jgi:hypothetical protein
MVRSVSSTIRENLLRRLNVNGLDISQLRSFLDLTNCTKTTVKPRKGSGDVGFSLHSRASHRVAIRNLPGLRRTAHTFFRTSAEYDAVVVLSNAVTVIRTSVNINGSPWDVGSYVEYVG